MKNRSLILLVLLLGMLVPARLVAQGGGAHPVIEIPKTRHDFGQIFEQKEYTCTFQVKNRGNADLVIEDVKPG